MISSDYSNVLETLNQIMKNTYNFSMIILISLLSISLVVWFIGIQIKSEKIIKSSIKTTISILFLIVFIVIMLIVIAKFKK